MRFAVLMFATLALSQTASAQDKIQVLLPNSYNISQYVPACAQHSGDCTQFTYNSEGELLAKLNDIVATKSDSALVVVLTESSNSSQLMTNAKTALERAGRSKETYFLTPTWSLQTQPGVQPFDLRAKAHETTNTGSFVRSMVNVGAFIVMPPQGLCPEGTHSCNGFCSKNCNLQQ
jgi:hypothetical protein